MGNQENREIDYNDENNLVKNEKIQPKNAQYYFSTEFDNLEDIMKENEMISENGLLKRNFKKNDYGITGGIHIVDLNDMKNYDYNRYLYEVFLPKDDPNFEMYNLLFGEHVNFLIMGQKYDICDIENINKLNINVNGELVSLIAFYDKIDTLENLRINKKLKEKYAEIIPFECNLVSTLEWYDKKFGFKCSSDSAKQLIEESVMNGSIEKCKWFIQKGYKIPKSIYSLERICEKNNGSMLELLKENKYKFTNLNKMVNIGLKNKQVKVLNWFISNKQLFDDDNVISFVLNGILSIIDEISNDSHMRKYTKNKELYKKEEFSMEYLDILNKLNIQLSDEIVKKLIIQFSVCGTDKHYQWLVDNQYKDAFENDEVDKAIKNAIREQNILVLNWFKNNSCSFEDLIGSLIMVAVKHKCVISLEWLRDNFTDSFNQFISKTTLIYHEILFAIAKHDDVDTYIWVNNHCHGKINKKIILTEALKYGSVNMLEDIYNKTSSTLDDIDINNIHIYLSENFNKSLEWLKSKDFKFTPEFINFVIGGISGYMLDRKLYGKYNNSTLVLQWLKNNVINVEDLPIILKNINDKNKIKWFKDSYPEQEKLIDDITRLEKRIEKKRMMF